MKADLSTHSPRLGISLLLVYLLIPLQGCGLFRHSPEGEGFFREEYDTQVRFERSGGIAGMPTVRRIDSESLSEKKRADLRNLIDRAGFFGLPEEIPGSPRPDEFLYTITIEIDGRRHTVRTTDTAAPEQLKPLIEWLNEMVKREPAGTG
jgi:hypothetical protein